MVEVCKTVLILDKAIHFYYLGSSVILFWLAVSYSETCYLSVIFMVHLTFMTCWGSSNPLPNLVLTLELSLDSYNNLYVIDKDISFTILAQGIHLVFDGPIKLFH